MKTRRNAFTLIELLVVILIIGIVSAATIPAVLPALQNRQMSESARILQATIEGVRDAAIRANEPRGLRFLPDPALPGSTTLADVPLAYNRIIPLEPAPEYMTGRVSVVRDAHPLAALAPYPGTTLPYPPGALRIEECRYDRTGLPAERTSWWGNVRVGDRVRIGAPGDGGSWYTVVGPLVDRPPVANPEQFVNVGPPEAANTWTRPYTTVSGATTADVEFLYLVNGRDDDGDGYTDEGWDGTDNDGDLAIDEIDEWEPESWVRPREEMGAVDLPYVIYRRPTPTRSGNVVTLPSGVVIDSTGWDSATRERSRLPVDRNTLYVEIMINPNGTIRPTTAFSTPTSAGGLPFYDFWLADRGDIHAPATAPAGSPRLPMPEGVVAGATVVLKGDRRLVSVFTRTGNVTTATMEVFDPTDTGRPYADAHAGIRDAR